MYIDGHVCNDSEIIYVTVYNSNVNILRAHPKDKKGGMKRLIPPQLTDGDMVGIVAPAGCFDKNIFNKGVEIIKKMGFNVYIPDGIFDRDRYLAGSDRHRAGLINELFAIDDIKGIICARGGYGSARILEFLNYNLIMANPKRFVGFSDISIILSVLNQRCKLVAWHGPVVTTLVGGGTVTKDSFYLSLTEPFARKIIAENGVTIRSGKAVGHLIGGNLASLCHLTGTPFEPEYKKNIIFFEDIGEPPYKIDRMLMQLKSAGMLKGVTGVVLGSFEKCGKIEEIYLIIKDIFDDNIPIFAGINAGHGVDNLTIPLGLKAKMDADRCELVFI